MALRFAIRCTPSASTAVTIAGKPSGTAATASATPRMKTSNSAAMLRTFSTRSMVPIIRSAITPTTIPSSRPTCASSFCSGVVSAVACCNMPAIRPISVFMPVAVTTAKPRPYVAAVPLKTMFVLSPSDTSSATAATSLATGKLSPVSAASATCRATDRITRASAGIVSPSSMRIMSPGTTSTAATLRRTPSRTTFAFAADICRNAVTACSARACCTYPITAFISTTAKIAIAS